MDYGEHVGLAIHKPMIRRRWNQFSLRGLLVAVTIGCIWLGWNVERARRRGRAIDALLQAGCMVTYDTGIVLETRFSGGDRFNHFWLDLRRSRIEVEGIGMAGLDLDTALARNIVEAQPVDEITTWSRNVDFVAYSSLTRLNDDCTFTFLKGLSPSDTMTIKWMFPTADIWVQD